MPSDRKQGTSIGVARKAVGHEGVPRRNHQVIMMG